MKKWNEVYYLTKGGLVYKLINGKLVHTECSRNSGGYLCLGCGGFVHRAVYELFKGSIPPGYHVHHKDHNKDNNSIDNLELIEAKQHLSEHALGRKQNKEWVKKRTKPKSEFGIKYRQHFGYGYNVGRAHYCREWRYYKQHKKCSWEK